MQVGSTLSVEKPQNGLPGLKHWRYDLVAGLVVSLVSLPFSLGIAMASGAPPVCGLISAIIAGLILPFLGGSLEIRARRNRIRCREAFAVLLRASEAGHR